MPFSRPLQSCTVGSGDRTGNRPIEAVSLWILKKLRKMLENEDHYYELLNVCLKILHKFFLGMLLWIRPLEACWFFLSVNKSTRPLQSVWRGISARLKNTHCSGKTWNAAHTYITVPQWAAEYELEWKANPLLHYFNITSPLFLCDFLIWAWISPPALLEIKVLRR